MLHLSAPAIVVFLIFATIDGSLAYYCWFAIQEARKRLQRPVELKTEYIRLRFGTIVMVLPLLGFSFGFIYFLFKTLQALWALVF
jgi:hypothetical protein